MYDRQSLEKGLDPILPESLWSTSLKTAQFVRNRKEQLTGARLKSHKAPFLFLCHCGVMFYCEKLRIPGEQTMLPTWIPSDDVNYLHCFVRNLFRSTLGSVHRTLWWKKKVKWIRSIFPNRPLLWQNRTRAPSVTIWLRQSFLFYGSSRFSNTMSHCRSFKSSVSRWQKRKTETLDWISREMCWAHLTPSRRTHSAPVISLKILSKLNCWKLLRTQTAWRDALVDRPFSW